MGIYQIAKKYKSRCCGEDIKLDNFHLDIGAYHIICSFICLKCKKYCSIKLKK